MLRIASRCALLVSCLLIVSCDSPVHVPDDAQINDTVTPADKATRDSTPPDISSIDVSPGDIATRDIATRDIATRDIAQGTGEYTSACCVNGAQNCPHGQCKPGLVCFVFPGGPYMDQGVCTQRCDTEACPESPAGNSTCFQDHCVYTCPPPPSGCDSSSCYGCPSGLNCRALVSQGYCMP